jgi:hypothetical protein
LEDENRYWHRFGREWRISLGSCEQSRGQQGFESEPIELYDATEFCDATE